MPADGTHPAPTGSDPEAVTSTPTVVQPGAPGEASTVVTAESLADRERPSWTEADDAFTQRDEIRLMQDWLKTRGLDYPEVVLGEGPMQGTMRHGAGHDMAGGAMDGGLMEMPGMLPPEQMEELRAAEGDTFDRLEGAFADLVVFDPDTVEDLATFEDPHQYPAAIPWWW